MTRSRRSCDLTRMSVTEIDIADVIGTVETMGADPLLTDAVVLLGEAKDKIAEFIEQEFHVSLSTDYTHILGDKEK